MDAYRQLTKQQLEFRKNIQILLSIDSKFLTTIEALCDIYIC